MPIMRGPSAVRHHIVSYLKTAFPVMAESYKGEWDDEYDFELPEKYDAYELTGISHGAKPQIGVEVSRATGFARVDYGDSMDEEYRPVYTVRIFLWTYTPHAQEQVPENARYLTLRARDDLGTILRATLLDRLTLGNPAFSLNEGTVVEDYSDASPTPNSSGRWLAAMSIGFDLQVDESLLREPIGTVPVEGVTVLSTLLQKVGE